MFAGLVKLRGKYFSTGLLMNLSRQAALFLGFAASVNMLAFIEPGQASQSAKSKTASQKSSAPTKASGAAVTKMPAVAPAFKKQKAISNATDTNYNFEKSTFRVELPASKNLSAATTLNAAALETLLNAKTVIKTEPAKSQTKPVPPEVFRAWLEKAHPQFALSTNALSEDLVLVVKGVYDNSGKTLKSLGIPFKQIRGADLASLPLSNTRIVIVNCPGRVPKQSIKSLQNFVASGGFLLTTDWSSDDVIQTAFPGYITWDKHKNKKAVYDAALTYASANSPLHTGLVTNAGWKMDIDSHMIKPLRPDVKIIAKSNELAIEDPQSQGILAVLFPYGKGYVMHLVGHFDNNTLMQFKNMLADPAPHIGISLRQAIAANFVVAAIQKKRL